MPEGTGFWLNNSLAYCTYEPKGNPMDAIPGQRKLSGDCPTIIFKGELPWMRYHEYMREPLAELVGAKPHEVVAMNSLTVNLHLMMVSFYRPRGNRNRILIEKQPFPSDRYAVESQIRFHGLDPDECLVELDPGGDGRLIDEGLVEDYLAENGESVALVLWPGVHYASGQLFDLNRIAAAGLRLHRERLSQRYVANGLAR